MSIISIRSMFEKKGCQAIMIVLAVALVVGMLLPSLLPGMGGQGGQQDPTLFAVGGTDVKAKQFDTLLRQQQASLGPAAEPDQLLRQIGGVIDQFVQQAATRQVAQKYGATTNEAQLKKWATESVDFQIEMMKMQAQMQGELKTGTQEEFAAFFKKNSGRTIEEAKAEITKNVDAELKKPEGRKALEDQFATKSIQEAAAKKITVTEETLKASYDNFSFHRISVVDAAMTPEKREEAAEKAREEIAAGKPIAEVFKRVMKSDITPPVEMPRSALEADEAQKVLLTLKPGELSPVVQQYGNPTFFQLVKKEPKLPPTFEKEKAKLLEDFKTQKASQQVTEEIKEAKKSVKIDWKQPELKVVHSVYLAISEPIGKTKADFEAILVQADALDADDSYKALSRYTLLNEIYNRATTEEQAELKEKKAEAAEIVLPFVESVAFRLTLVDQFVELKNNDKAFEVLAEAAGRIASFDSMTTADAGRVELKASQLETSKVLTKEQADEVRAVITQWRSDKAAYEKEEAEARKEAELEEKRMLEEEKKMEAEEKKKEEAEKAAAAKSAPKSDAKPSGTAPAIPGMPAAPGN